MLPILLLLAMFCLNNARRAKMKQLNPVAWVSYTILSFCTGLFIACVTLGMIIMAKNPELLSLAQTNDRPAMNKFMIENFAQNEFVYSSLIMAGGFGGYLLIRFLIDKKNTPAA